ncbi:MAG: DEAD/DEAH box helicase [Chitinophagales bacterium]|nr:DEAD/DEAH box helicase [Chitinophagales bacterium]
MNFSKINPKEILANMGFKELNSLQKEVLSKLDTHSEILLLAPTGSGKTLAFILSILKQLHPNKEEVQTIVLAPTRELALQIEKVFRQVKSGYKVLSCYGGHPFSREKASLKHPPAVLIATPGRLLDHLQRQSFNTSAAQQLIIDEYDKCLELGFGKEMQSILYHLPKIKNCMLTSATQINELPPYFKLKKPLEINFLDQDLEPDLSYFYVKSTWSAKMDTMCSLLKTLHHEPSIVFCNFKNDIQALSEALENAGLDHSVFYGDLDQEEREKALLKFRNGSTNILLATDLAARGLDIPEIKHIVHYQIPSKEDSFVHRNGRTARMQASGKVFLMLNEDKTLPEYIKHPIEAFEINESPNQEESTSFTTIYMSAGKMHKISKIDVLGFLCQIGNLSKEEIGIIEVKDRASFAAIPKEKLQAVLKACDMQKLKKVKVRVDRA